MRIPDFNIEDLIENLRGTCSSLDMSLPDDMSFNDLSIEEIEKIDSEIFECQECNWWYEIIDMSEEEHICIDCKENR
jgi:hypothetical protein